MSVTVKICGIQKASDALVAAEAGADFIGLMFAPSRRRIDLETGRHIVTSLRQSHAGRDVTVVGVFVNEELATIREVAEQVGLDWVQLSGHEPFTIQDDLTLPTIKTIRFDDHPSEAGWLQTTSSCDLQPIHVDAHVPGSFGGTGVVGDWHIAAQLAAQRPILLSGGLSSDNVAAAIAAVKPWGVDVSSGVETNGIKDLVKIRAFIEAAKEASR